ncbi:hypothetical protein D9758_013762 [Tetrapyrgos nigripes]|uniref:Nephrocystin 3-like N-terminal domain-containing protein n=1 Tax=Tetrapyrgos nigripes TaxID=182062 RepID=A0A8H5D5K6_9AGAR|nr:hypothetical protein D9758_013762 [Tetrapyrgos nigripes]
MASEIHISGPHIGLFNQSSQFIIKDTTINVVSGDQFNNSSIMVENAKGTEWITAPDPLENFRIAYLKIVENTGAWLLEDESFQKWKNNGELLWLQGKAGSGKTLCTNIINNLWKEVNAVAVFYYFDTRDQAKVNYDGFVSSLLCQVAGKANNEHAQAKLQTLYNNSHEGEFLVAEDKGAILIDLIMTIDKAIYIVIDGVDECKEQTKVVDLVGNLSKLNNCFVLLASRPHLNMARIAAGQKITISLGDKDVVNADIKRYVDIKIEQSEFSEELKTEIKTALVNGGNGQADVNAQGGYYGNALHIASILGHLEIVRALLENGADVNVQGGRYGNALHATSIGGHLEIVKVLLGNRADVNAQGRYYGNALQAASIGGHLEVVKVLLEYRADVNVQGGYYGNALQAATCEGHVFYKLQAAKAI